MTSDEELKSFLDKAALAELVAILSAAVDRADRQGIIACYAEDSYDDHGAFKGSGREFAEMICGPTGPGQFMTTHHLLGQSVFTIERHDDDDEDDDEAWGETFFVMHAVIGDRTSAGFGRYIDYFRRVDGRWKLVYRRVVPDASIKGDDVTKYWQSRSDRSDPRHDRLTSPPSETPPSR